MNRASVFFLLTFVFLLVVGTFQLDFLTRRYTQLNLPQEGVLSFQQSLHRLVPFDPRRGEEGVTAQGALLIGMLGLIGVSAWKGLESILEGFNIWTWVSTGLVGITLMIASLGMTPHPGGLTVGFTGKFFGVTLTVFALVWMLKTQLSPRQAIGVLWESWRFVKQIFPLLIVGVFAVGMIREIIRPGWIQTLAGSNTLTGNFIGVVFGVFMYFPTLVEVPIAQMFLELGMHRGPLLDYLISDPELSLQSILLTASIIGRLKAWVYVFWVSIFSTLSGLIYGAWVNGTSPGLVAPYLRASLAALGLGIWFTEKEQAKGKVVGTK